MTLDEIGQELLTKATIKLIDEIWDQSIGLVINSHDLITGVKIFNNILLYSYNTLGFDDDRFDEYFKALCFRLDELEHKHHANYQRHPLYKKVKRLRGLTNANAADLLAPEVGFWAEANEGPSQKDTMEFMEKLLGKVYTMLDLAFEPNNQFIIHRNYVKDIFNQGFHPTTPNEIPRLILENLAPCQTTQAKEWLLDKMLPIFYPDLTPYKTTQLKQTFVKLDQVNDQLKLTGYGYEELNEALIYYKKLTQLMQRKPTAALKQARDDGKKGRELASEMRRLMAIPLDPFPQQEPELSEALAKQFGLNIPGASPADPNQKHLKILKGAYLTATSLSTRSIPKDDIPVIANLQYELWLKNNFLEKVQTQSLALTKQVQ